MMACNKHYTYVIPSLHLFLHEALNTINSVGVKIYIYVAVRQKDVEMGLRMFNVLLHAIIPAYCDTYMHTLFLWFFGMAIPTSCLYTCIYIYIYIRVLPIGFVKVYGSVTFGCEMFPVESGVLR